ncbi:MAG: hypothetical protein AAGB28_19945 [Pseudomonadota bacterium]
MDFQINARMRRVGCAVLAAAFLAGCGGSEGSRAVSGAAIGGITLGVLTGGVGLGILAGGAAGVMCNDVNPQYCVD